MGLNQCEPLVFFLHFFAVYFNISRHELRRKSINYSGSTYICVVFWRSHDTKKKFLRPPVVTNSMSAHASDRLSDSSHVSTTALQWSLRTLKSKVSLTEWVTRPHIELSWTAKKRFVCKYQRGLHTRQTPSCRHEMLTGALCCREKNYHEMPPFFLHRFCISLALL